MKPSNSSTEHLHVLFLSLMKIALSKTFFNMEMRKALRTDHASQIVTYSTSVIVCLKLL